MAWQAATGIALGGALAYGVADFLGGLAARRIGTPSTVLLTQLIAAGTTFSFLAAAGAPIPIDRPLFMALSAGFAYAFAVTQLYTGFAYGRISIVAPLCGILSVTVPTIAELWWVRILAPFEMMGIVLAAGSIVAITAAVPENSDIASRQLSVRAGLLSGTSFGLADALIGSMQLEQAIGALFVARLVAALCALAAFGHTLAFHRTDRFTLIPALGIGSSFAVVAGTLDAVGHLGYAIAAAIDSMSIAAALVSLFPCVSVVLAVMVLRESLSRLLLCGIVTSAASIMVLSTN
jgi:drug/metabolite transporter (DMT)-like permease